MNKIIFAALALALVIGLTIFSIYHDVNVGKKVSEFSDKCNEAGGVVTQIDVFPKTRWSCSVTSLRLKHADSLGNVKCYTCDYQNHWKKIQNGHLVSRYYLNTRFDERNCRPQCYTCNMFRNGMIPDFSQRLEQELGEGITKELYRDANKLVHDFPYEVKIKEYKEKLQTYANLLR